MPFANREAQRAYEKAWRAKNKDKVDAARQRYEEKNKERLARERAEKARDPEAAQANREKAARYIAALRESLFAAYRRACVCCGEHRVEFLTFDHPNDDGADRRREHGGAHQEWRAVRRAGFPAGYYEVRCYNCNCARYRHGVCPHEAKRQGLAHRAVEAAA